MAQAPVPSNADFFLRCPKPEAFSGIDSAVIAAALADETDACAAYYADRAILPLTQVDGGFVKAVCHRAALTLMSSRGFNPNANADKTIPLLASRADKWLDRVLAKELQPFFVDSSGQDQSAPLAGTSERSDAWVDSCR